MPVLFLGNVSVTVPLAAAEAVTHVEGELPPAPEVATMPHLGQQITRFELPAGVSADEVAGVWRGHSTHGPAWVEGDDAALVAAVAALFGCPVGCPVSHDEWKEG